MQPQFEVLPPNPRTPQPPRPKRGGILGWLAGLGVLLFKFKTVGTMLLSIGAYSLICGWKFAAGLVLLIFVHELGHIIAARAYGVPVSAPTFIPFVGAYVLLNRPMDPFVNAIISYAGPLAGGLGGWAVYFLGQELGAKWLLAVAFYTFVLNLLNLAPIPPLDGSHIWRCFSRRATPSIPTADRGYLGIFLAALVAGLILGCMTTWGNLPPPSSLRP